MVFKLQTPFSFVFLIGIGIFFFFKSLPDIFPQVGNLESGRFYQFRVFAANVAGVGKPSEASEAFLCEKWTMAEPGKDRGSCLILSSLFLFLTSTE